MARARPSSNESTELSHVADGLVCQRIYWYIVINLGVPVTSVRPRSRSDNTSQAKHEVQLFLAHYTLPTFPQVYILLHCNVKVFLPRDAMHKRGYSRHAVSVCPSIRLSRSWIMSKRINISSKFFHHRVATAF